MTEQDGDRPDPEKKSFWHSLLSGKWPKKLFSKGKPQVEHYDLKLFPFDVNLPVPDPERRLNILDLGAASERGAWILPEHARRFHFGDLWDTITHRSPETTVLIEDELKGVFPKDDDISFDLILCWDLLNYLKRDELTHFGDILGQHVHPRTLVHMLSWTTKQIPTEPAHLSSKGSGCVEAEYPPPDMNLENIHQRRDLQKIIPGLKLVQSTLFRNGMREDVFYVTESKRAKDADE